MHAWDVLGLDNLIAPNIFYLRSNLLGASNTMFENGQKYLIEFSLCQKLKYFSNLILAQKSSFTRSAANETFSTNFKTLWATALWKMSSRIFLIGLNTELWGL